MPRPSPGGSRFLFQCAATAIPAAPARSPAVAYRRSRHCSRRRRINLRSGSMPCLNSVGRFSGVRHWPVLAVPRGLCVSAPPRLMAFIVKADGDDPLVFHLLVFVRVPTCVVNLGSRTVGLGKIPDMGFEVGIVVHSASAVFLERNQPAADGTPLALNVKIFESRLVIMRQAPFAAVVLHCSSASLVSLPCWRLASIMLSRAISASDFGRISAPDLN